MSMRLSFIALVAAALVATAVMAQPARAADDTVVAIVNGDKIYKKDVDAAIKTLPPQSQNSDKVFPMVLDQIISDKLLDEASSDAKIEQSDDYKKRLDALKAQLVKQMYFEKILKGKVTESAIKAEYNKFKDANKGKMEIHARHILVPTKEEADKVIEDLNKGAKFEDLAQQRSSGPTAQKGGDLGWFTKEEMIPEFSDVAFKTKPGTYTKTPVHTQFGWHVIKVEESREREVPKLDDQIEMAIRNKLSQEELLKTVEQLRAKAKIEKFDANGKPLKAESAKDEDAKASKASDKKDDDKDDSKE